MSYTTDRIDSFIAALEYVKSKLGDKENVGRVGNIYGIDIFTYTKQEFVDTVKAMGTGVKVEASGNRGIEFEIPGTDTRTVITVNPPFNEDEAVCEKVQVGTETVEVPDPNAPKIIIEQPVYEIRCPDSILALGELA